MKNKINNNSILNLKLKLILFCTLFIIGLSSQDTSTKIYIFKIKTKGDTQVDLDKKVRNMILVSILKNYSQKYRVLDDDSIQNLSEKLRKLQLSGCSDEICIQEISNALDANEFISGTIYLSKGMVTLEMKNLRKDPYTFMQTIKSNPPPVTFPLIQLDYFVDEVTKKLIEPSYEINYSKAPPILGDLDGDSLTNDTNFLYTSDIHPINSILYNVGLEFFKIGEKERLDKNYKKSLEYFIYVHERFNNILDNDEKKQAIQINNWLLEKILLVTKEIYKEKLKELDSQLSSNQLEELDLKYEDLILDILNIKKEYRPIDLISALYYRKSLVFAKKGDELVNKLSFSASRKEFEKAIQIIQKIPSSHKKDYSNYEISIQSKFNQVNKLGKDYLENVIKSTCEAGVGYYFMYIANKSRNPEEAENNYRLAIEKMNDAKAIISKERNFIDDKLINYCSSEEKKIIKR